MRTSSSGKAGCSGRLRAALVGSVAVAIVGGWSATASAVPILFDTFSPGTTGISVLGGVVETGIISFTDIATDNGTTVDAKVTATTIKPQTDFGPVGSNSGSFGAPGYIPDYTAAASEPNDDLGFLFYGNGINSTENGITLEFEFFDGTGALSGTFTDPLSISEIKFAIYDVDGENTQYVKQSEFFRVNKSDGLVSYQLGNTPQALTATDLGDKVLFEGPGVNFAEDDASGAAILVFENTSAFTLDFGAVQMRGPSQNGVFTGFDGDLSLFSDGDFGDPVVVGAVPLPAGFPLLAGGLAVLGWFCRRQIFGALTKRA